VRGAAGSEEEALVYRGELLLVVLQAVGRVLVLLKHLLRVEREGQGRRMTTSPIWVNHCSRHELPTYSGPLLYSSLH
jgi:hypothetical protein